MNPLQQRLAVVRRRLRFVATFRGVCLAVSLLLLAVLLSGLLDWRVHLPSAVRAFLLAATLGSCGYVAARYLVAPLQARADDLALALKVETRYPELNDALASAVQFLEHSREAAEERRPTLRQEAVRRALDEAEHRDFAAVIDERGTRPAGTALLGAGGVAVLLLIWQPALARTALLRLADPFGVHDWPRQTQLTLQAESRAARGEAFPIRGTVRGVLPETATIRYRFADDSRLEQTCEIQRGGTREEGTFEVRLEPERVHQAFRFQVAAHDAATEWRSVAVLPPPQLVPLNGRPSPHVRLHHPAYADLPDLALPDGTTSVEALAGTTVTLHAATDRPLARAWLEHPPETLMAVDTARAVGCLAVPWLALDPQAGRRIPAQVAAGGQSFALEFLARLSSVFVLRVEDDSGLGSNRLFEVRVVADPAPVVQLERPTKVHDSFEVLPRATVTLQVLAEDVQFALRTVWVDYRITRADRHNQPENGRVLLYDPRLAAEAATRVTGLPPTLFRVRPQRQDRTVRWSLAALQLHEGDTVRVQAFADDFDDVMVGKLPGRSHEVELHVVSRTTLERLLHEWQLRVQQELQALSRLQQDAQKRIAEAEAALRKEGKLEPRHLDDVVQAEQMQQQVRARVGNATEGLRAEVRRILQALRDNGMPRAGAQDRLQATQAELDRLAREHLDQVEPRLHDVRKDQETGTPRPASEKNPLGEARKHQEEIRRTLHNLLKLLEPWSQTSERKAQARLLLEEQRRLARETEKLSQDMPLGTSRGEMRKQQEKLEADARLQRRMTDETRKRLEQLKAQQAALDRAAETQNKLTDRLEELLNKLENAGTEPGKPSPEKLDKSARPVPDPAAAKELRDAAQQARKADIANAMRGAEQNLRDAAVGKAREQQQRSMEGLEQMVQTLEEQREAELDRLRKRLLIADEHLAKMEAAQEELRKRTAKAAAQADPRERERELRRLTREQEKIQKEIEEAIQELTRLRRTEAQQQVIEAGNQLDKATRRLQEGADPQAQQEQALARLNEARRDLQESAQAVEEELLREKLAKLADQIKGLKERQESRLEESARVQREVLQRKQWTRALLASLLDLARTQEHLAKETAGLADNKAARAEVVALLLRRTAATMEKAAAQLRLRVPDVAAEFDPAAEQAADAAVQQLQRRAIRSFDTLLEALNPLTGQAGKNQSGPESGDSGPEPGSESGDTPPGSSGPRAPGEGISPVVELRVLKAIQEDLNERTRLFAQQHPDVGKLSPGELAELEALRQEQLKVAELLEKITSALMPKEEKP